MATEGPRLGDLGSRHAVGDVVPLGEGRAPEPRTLFYSMTRPASSVYAYIRTFLCFDGVTPTATATPKPTPSSSTPVSCMDNRAIRPSSLACTECRRKHLKCDSIFPPCSRCAKRHLVCTYRPSRRGYRPRPCDINNINRFSIQEDLPLPLPRDGNSSPLPDPSIRPVSPTTTPDVPVGLAIATDVDSAILQSQEHLGLVLPSGPSMPSQRLMPHSEEHWVNLYYLHFHAYHPILLPRSRYKAHPYPNYLKLVVQFIGSQYTPSVTRKDLKFAADMALTDTFERSAYVIQSLLLYAVCLHAQAEGAKAISVLAKATGLAIELGLNCVDFAKANSNHDSLLEESLRRTWWELYVIDGYFAALHRQVTFACSTVELTAYLPCEESEYQEGGLLESKQGNTLDQFDPRFFADQEQCFASACYRVEAICIMGRVLALTDQGASGADDVQAVDNALAAWRLYLPASKEGIIDCFGRVDHMILEAYAFVHTASILLHFPRSEFLLTIPLATDIACTARMTQASPTSTQHATKAVSASKDLSDLASLPIGKHAPLFICSLVFGCIVQLSACCVHPHDCISQHHDRIALIIGMLKSMGRQWAVANDVSRHLNKIADSVFRPLRGHNPSMSGASPDDSGVDMSFVQDDMSWFDLFTAGDSGGPDSMYGQL